MNIKQTIQQLIKDTTGIDVEVVKPKSDFGDYAVFARGNAQALSEKLKTQKIPEIEKIEVKGQYINFFLSKEFLWSELERMSDATRYALHEYLKGQKIMVEYTDANIMKPFHIGHVMSNAIGEAISRLLEASGAEVKRANYYGDIGLHVAKTVFAMQTFVERHRPAEDASDIEKSKYLGACYAAAHTSYDDPEYKSKIDEVNKKLYDKSDPELNKLLEIGKRWSEAHVAKIHERLGTKFDFQFPESTIADDGIKYIMQGLEKGVFEKSEGAIVFKGEPYGLHTRVFITSKGLPVYEAKDFGLNTKKYELYKFDRSIIITGNEQNEYFKVVLKAMSLLFPEIASKTMHIGHGLMKLASGKMSSRKGNVVTGEQFLEQVTEKTGSEEVAIGAIKYSILKQGIGHDVVFDREKSIAVNGDTGVYLQYTYARLVSILTKAAISNDELLISKQFKNLNEQNELNIIKHLIEFPEAVREATERLAPNVVALYCYELANLANRYYEEVRILDDTDEVRKQARLVLINTVATILKRGLAILAIKTPSKI